MARPAHRAYHHGDLRNACIREGSKLLARGGPEELSLRAIARRIGVSPRAPYRHFADKPALLAAIAEEGFSEFGRAMLRALARAGAKSPARRLRALGASYVEFSLQHPRLLQLMFGDSFPDRARRFPSLHRTALATFAILEGEVARLVPDSSRRRRALAATAAWAMVHGLSDLLRTAQLQYVLPDDRSRRQIQRFAVSLFLRGIASR